MTYNNDIEAVTLSDILGLASWNRPRSSVELRSFVNQHDDALDVEDFELDA
ncbi:MAG TPA: hypothetical protein PKV96_03945 [Candidatus Saccharimonas sp.]|jgi:hypothetical protein|nr:hypothetical protein [Candidatus Saccharimonas sp.]